MEHPLIGNLDHFTVDQLYEQINNLNTKLAWARRHNAELARQISMMLDSYQQAYMNRQKQQVQQSGSDYTDRIDIS